MVPLTAAAGPLDELKIPQLDIPTSEMMFPDGSGGHDEKQLPFLSFGQPCAQPTEPAARSLGAGRAQNDRRLQGADQPQDAE
ncbi:MAG: hypothetical protein WDN69_12465 [Aliidongia sp.]